DGSRRSVRNAADRSATAAPEPAGGLCRHGPAGVSLTRNTQARGRKWPWPRETQVLACTLLHRVNGACSLPAPVRVRGVCAMGRLTGSVLVLAGVALAAYTLSSSRPRDGAIQVASAPAGGLEAAPARAPSVIPGPSAAPEPAPVPS